MKIDPSTRTLRVQALAIVRDELLSGRLVPGKRVNEVQMAREIGISRGTLREALRILEQEGMLVSVAHKGTYVRRFTRQEAGDLQEVRLSLEVTAACRVAALWTPEIESLLFDRLEVLRRAYVEPLPFPDRLRADLGFHGAVCDSSGNRTLCGVWYSLIGQITVMVLNVGVERMTRLQDPDQHRPLIDAIASGDEAGIRETYRQHFAAGQRVVDAAFADQARTAADEPLTTNEPGLMSAQEAPLVTPQTRETRHQHALRELAIDQNSG